MYDIIIVGAGPAGLSAAIYGQRAGKKTLVLEGKQYGGQIVMTPEIENYPGIPKTSGVEFATNLYQQALNLGAEILMEEVLEVLNEPVKSQALGIEKESGGNLTTAECRPSRKLVKTSGHIYEGKAVIIAAGATRRKLGLENEERLTGAGVSYCATCDGMFFRGKDVAVNGGGNTALEDALFLSNYCSRVYVIHRRAEFRGERRLQDALEERENVVFLLDSEITAIHGETRLESLTVRNKKTGEEQILEVSGLFVAIGQQPDSEQFRSVVSVDEQGYIIAEEDCRTSAEGIFTAGDCRTKKVRQLTTAAADGTVAALSACEYIG